MGDTLQFLVKHGYIVSFCLRPGPAARRATALHTFHRCSGRARTFRSVELHRRSLLIQYSSEERRYAGTKLE
jgi:hypothetical protein